MLEQGGWLTSDPFTLGRGDQRWFANQWLGDLLLWLANRWAGLTGIAAVVTLVLALTFRLLYGMLIRDGLPWTMAICWAFLAALGTSSGWVARPNVFTILFALITARVCDRVHRGEHRPYQPWLLLPLFTIWANTHGGFIAGFIILAASVLIELAIGFLADAAEDRQAARGRARLLGLVTLGASACTLINPYGVELYSWLFQLLGDPYFMNLHVEWQSPDFHDKGAFRYELLILLFPVILAYSEKKPTLLLLSLAVLWLHFALDGRRYVPLFVVIVTPLLARHSLEIGWLKERAQRWLSDDVRRLLGSRDNSLPSKREGEAPAEPMGSIGKGSSHSPDTGGSAGASPSRDAMDMLRRAIDNNPWFWTVVFAVAFLTWARWNEDYAQHNPRFTPTQALDRALERYDGRPIFHSYGWGGYLTWHGWDKQPRLLNWIDDRNEVQGRAHIQEFFALTRGEPGWRKKLDEANVGLIVLPPWTPLVLHLKVDSSWRQVYEDEYGVIFERAGQSSSSSK